MLGSPWSRVGFILLISSCSLGMSAYALPQAFDVPLLCRAAAEGAFARESQQWRPRDFWEQGSGALAGSILAGDYYLRNVSPWFLLFSASQQHRAAATLVQNQLAEEYLASQGLPDRLTVLAIGATDTDEYTEPARHQNREIFAALRALPPLDDLQKARENVAKVCLLYPFLTAWQWFNRVINPHAAL